MLFRIGRSLGLGAFKRLTARLGETPPIAADAGPAVLVTMLAHAHLHMYLLAAKSFLAAVGPCRVQVLDDGTLTADDHALLGHHLPGLRILPISGVDVEGCQRGGCWERLVHVLRTAETDYVIQLDSDTLTIGPLPEIHAAIAARRGFFLADQGCERRGMLEYADWALAMVDDHMNVAGERFFKSFPDAASLHYARATGGFVGFAPGTAPLSRVLGFHARMAEMAGPRWREWGTEQIASNFMVANTPDPVRLPADAYVNHSRATSMAKARFVHFIGSDRFHRLRYALQGRRAVARLLRAEPIAGQPVAALPG
jgi:hypothetical protein